MPNCAKMSVSKVNLRVPLKECHTKPDLKSPMHKKIINLVKEEENGVNSETSTTLQEKSIHQKRFNGRYVISTQRQRMS